MKVMASSAVRALGLGAAEAGTSGSAPAPAGGGNAGRAGLAAREAPAASCCAGRAGRGGLSQGRCLRALRRYSHEGAEVASLAKCEPQITTRSPAPPGPFAATAWRRSARPARQRPARRCGTPACESRSQAQHRSKPRACCSPRSSAVDGVAVTSTVRMWAVARPSMSAPLGAPHRCDPSTPAQLTCLSWGSQASMVEMTDGAMSCCRKRSYLVSDVCGAHACRARHRARQRGGLHPATTRLPCTCLTTGQQLVADQVARRVEAQQRSARCKRRGGSPRRWAGCAARPGCARRRWARRSWRTWPRRCGGAPRQTANMARSMRSALSTHVAGAR